MKYQLEQLDLVRPWPHLALREGYHAMVVLVRLGAIPIGEVVLRPVRKRAVTHRRLRRIIARKLAGALLKNLVREGLAAGPDALMSIPAGAFSQAVTATSPWSKTVRLVETELLLPEGLPEPMRTWISAAQSRADVEMPAVTVAVCTRDRGSILEGCIRHLQNLDYPKFEIMVVDNSTDPVPTREIAERCGVTYVRCRKGGLSRARNAAIISARHEWIAFTDDDCRPEANWLRELARPTQDPNCRAVCGLVLPAQLENAAEITFEIYGGLGRGYAAKVFDPGFLTESLSRPAPTWRIGAGANMLLHAGLMRKLGGYDIDMGPGPRSVGGCGEDTDIFYQVLREGFNIHYAPRAMVHHYHRSSPKALRKQIYSYAVGHAAYHTRCLFAYGDYRSLLQLVWHLPKWFVRNLRRGVSGRTKYPFSLVFLEMRGTAVGPFRYAAAKARRWFRHLLEKPQPVHALDPIEPRPVHAHVTPARPALPRKEHDSHRRDKSFRAA